MERFDVIVVGAGPAGCAAAYGLARAGVGVLLIERGSEAGSKNVSGGLLYTAPIAGAFGSPWDQAPVERRVTAHKLLMLDDRRSVGLEFNADGAGCYSVLRARFDPWLVQRAEEAGAVVVTGVTVDELLLDGSTVVGVRAGTDEIGADVVVVADGTRSLLLAKGGLRAPFDPHDVALGVKEIITLPGSTIEERFGLEPGTGSAYTTVGRTAGVEGGGFLYTNRESISLGVVVKLDSLTHRGIGPEEVLDDFKSHPVIERAIRGGRTVEYAAQTVHRGRYEPGQKLSGAGYVVAGSAGRLLLNNMLTLRGMDFAIVSGTIAAKAITMARADGRFDAASLGRYESLLAGTSVYRDWRRFAAANDVMSIPRLFREYPRIVSDVAERMLVPTDRPSPKALSVLRRSLRRRVSVTTAAKDAYRVFRGFAR